jgi:hypothetical protein
MSVTLAPIWAHEAQFGASVDQRWRAISFKTREIKSNE